MRILGGYWKIGRRSISLNEGGYGFGLIWSRGRIFDAWFKFPIRGWRSLRITRWVSGEWGIGRW